MSKAFLSQGIFHTQEQSSTLIIQSIDLILLATDSTGGKNLERLEDDQ